MKKLKAILFISLATILFGCNANNPSTSISEDVNSTESSISESTKELSSTQTSEPESSFNNEDLMAIINNSFGLSDFTVLTVNIPSATNKEIFINNEVFYENVNGKITYIYQHEGKNYKASKVYGTEKYEKVEYLEHIEYNLGYLFSDYTFEINDDILEYSFPNIADFEERSGYRFTNASNSYIGVSLNEEKDLLENIYIFDENDNITDIFKIKQESKNISVEQIEKLVNEGVHEHVQMNEYFNNDSQHWKVCETCYESYDYEDHSLETIDAIKATCVSQGYTEGLKCSVCDYYESYPQSIPFADHEFEETWKVVKEPTYANGGEEHQDCKNCDQHNVRYTPKLEIPVPEVLISDSGVASWPIVEGIDTYSIKTGAREPEYFEDTLQINENFFQLANSQYIQVAYVADGNIGRYSEFQLFEYNYDSIDLLKNVSSIDTNSDGSYTLNVKLDDTTNIRLKLENGVYNSAGNIEFNSETRLYSLDSLSTIISYHIDALSPSVNVEKSIYIDEGVNVANKMSVTNKEELDYYPSIITTTNTTVYSETYSNYFEIYSYEEFVITNIIIQYTKDFKYDCNGFKYQSNGYPFLEGTRASLFTTQSIWLEIKRDVPNLEPYQNVSFPISKAKILGFVDENGNKLPSDTIIKEGVKMQIEYQDIVNNVDIGFIEKANYSSYYESHPYQNVKAIGNIKSLVIPIVWNDQKDMKKEDILLSIKTALGNVIDENGNVTTYDYEDASKFTLSEYMNISSYGKLRVNSFVTDWFESEYNYDDIRDYVPEDTYVESIVNWAINTYNLNIKDFDHDNDGVIDSIIILHTGVNHNYDYYVQASWAGAVRWTFHDQTKDDNYDYIINANSPKFVNATTSSISFIYKDVENYNVENSTALTLIHEFAHNFGLVDYYSDDSNDVLGGYDMQTSNVGDWNAFSKFAVGWVDPTVINKDDFANGNTITFTLEEFVENGNVLLIPAKNHNYNGTPFDEYIMIDLFTPNKLHEFDSINYGLNETVGVRIYHVNGTMRLMKTYSHEFGEHNFSAAKTNDYGAQIIELIQKGKVNEFQDDEILNNTISSKDFFYEGDIFDVSEYDEFFYKGLMDDGDEFGYVINIKSIYLDETTNTYKAEIEITLK